MKAVVGSAECITRTLLTFCYIVELLLPQNKVVKQTGHSIVASSCALHVMLDCYARHTDLHAGVLQVPNISGVLPYRLELMPAK